MIALSPCVRPECQENGCFCAHPAVLRGYGSMKDDPTTKALVAAIEPAKDPVDAIERMLAARGWSRKHLGPAIGTSGRISDIMNRRRPLSLPMVRALVINYGMDATEMIQWYPTASQPIEPTNIFEDVERKKRAEKK